MADEEETRKTEYRKSYFDVQGMCCSSEVGLIEKLLRPIEGVREITVVVPSRTLIVFHDNLLVSEIQIVRVLNQAKLEASVRIQGGKKNERRKWPSPYAIVCGLLLTLSFLKFVYPPMKWLAVGAVAAGIYPVAVRGLVSLKNFRLDINILMLIAVAGTIVLKDYLESASIVFLFTISQWLEAMASHKATSVMSSLISLSPQRAVVADTGREVAVEDLKLNTVVAVKAGELIPVDGVVVEGKCEVDEKTLTGESFPSTKQKDSTVWAGTINLNGYICVRTTAISEECVLARMTKLVEEAQKNKSSTERLIDRISQFYTPAVVLISAGIAAIPAALRVNNQSYWFHLSLVVLVSACPCALILSTPVATFCALSKAAASGVLIKGGDVLEVFGKTKVMAFDKTGTLTEGEFVVEDFRSFSDDITFETLLYWVSSIESKSSHPVAAALVDYGRLHSVTERPDVVEEFQNFPGEGICGKIDGHLIYVGNKRISARAGCEIVRDGVEEEGGTVACIYRGSELVGYFQLSDSCRPGALKAVRELKALGIRCVMLTGDSRAAATISHNQLENVLDEVHAELLPEGKADLIRGFHKQGRVAMVGDGINDALALATADIGVSMGVSGSALAVETGHITLMSNNLGKIPASVLLARAALSKVVTNIIFSIAAKSAILALAVSGHPLVWAAVMADTGTCLLVIFNSMLLLRGGRRHHHHKGGRRCDRPAPHLHGTEARPEPCCRHVGPTASQNHGTEARSDEPCCRQVGCTAGDAIAVVVADEGVREGGCSGCEPHGPHCEGGAERGASRSGAGFVGGRCCRRSGREEMHRMKEIVAG